MTYTASWVEQILRDCTYSKITIVVELADAPPGFPGPVTIECGPGRAQIGINRVVEERNPIFEGAYDPPVPGITPTVYSQPVLSVAAKPHYDRSSMITIATGAPHDQGPVRSPDPA